MPLGLTLCNTRLWPLAFVNVTDLSKVTGRLVRRPQAGARPSLQAADCRSSPIIAKGALGLMTSRGKPHPQAINAPRRQRQEHSSVTRETGRVHSTAPPKPEGEVRVTTQLQGKASSSPASTRRCGAEASGACPQPPRSAVPLPTWACLSLGNRKAWDNFTRTQDAVHGGQRQDSGLPDVQGLKVAHVQTLGWPTWEPWHQKRRELRPPAPVHTHTAAVAVRRAPGGKGK